MKKLFIYSVLILSLSTNSNANDVVENTISREGVHYVNTRIEESKYGISSWVLDDFYKEYDIRLKVKDLTYKQAVLVADKMIYDKNNIHMINNIDKRNVIYDFIFNSGRGKKIIQVVINDYIYKMRKSGSDINYIKVDGIFGKNTIKMINEIDTNTLCENITLARIDHIRKWGNRNKFNSQYVDGLIARAKDVRNK